MIAEIPFETAHSGISTLYYYNECKYRKKEIINKIRYIIYFLISNNACNNKHMSEICMHTYLSLSVKKPQTIFFLEIPSEVFSQLRVQEWKLSWDPPENCTTISGPMETMINIRGISDAVKDFNVSTTTSYYFLDLYKLYPKLSGFERYVATVYVIRDNSSKEYASANQTHEFETPPKGKI